MSGLQSISGIAQDIAEAIKAAFSMDVEIVDKNLKRIAATGVAKNKIDQSMNFGTASNEVLKSGEVIVIKSNEHPICKICPGKGKCTYFGGIISPLFFNKKVIGTINLVSYDEMKMNQIYEKRQELIDFINKMGELLTSKIMERALYLEQKELMSELKKMVNTSPFGVISFDEDYKVKYFNPLAKEILNLNDLHDYLINKLFKDLSFSAFESLDTSDVYEGIVESVEGLQLSVTIHNFINSKGTKDFIIFIHPLFNKKVNKVNNVSISDIIGNSPKMKDVKVLAKKFSNSPSTILITGESGTGKDLIARAIHYESNRREKPFVVVNCGAIPDTLIESELFGYEKGAFTGANSYGKPGKFELANKGTIFLDEISTMPYYLQSRLLTAIQNRQIDRIGGTKTITLDVRIIAATNENLDMLVKNKKFRSDLFYRLNVLPIDLPPLRDRQKDILLISQHIIKKLNSFLGRSVQEMDDQTKELLLGYHWEGNIRELENVLEYAMNLLHPNDQIIKEEHLPYYIIDCKQQEKDGSSPQTIEKLERNQIAQLLNQWGDSLQAKQKISSTLGISISTLYRKIKRYDLHHYS